jgi:hypothetical protein
MLLLCLREDYSGVWGFYILQDARWSEQGAWRVESFVDRRAEDLGVRAFPGASDNKGVLGQEKAGRNQLAWGHLNPNGKLAESR